jgi:ring-1,2-phenylacetyl-CoA epoxidase subunit PaaC
LLALADDELVLGYRESEWTGVAPLLEEDVALSSIAQDEIGHARALYALCAALRDGAGPGDPLGDAALAAADALAYDRVPEAFLHAPLCERPRGDWGEEIARRLLYELADALRLASLTRSSLTTLAQLAERIGREEAYHLEHARAWLVRLAADDEGRPRLQAGLDALWGDALALLEPLRSEPELLAHGVLPEPWGALRERYVELVRQELAACGVPLPAGAAAERRSTARGGDCSPVFASQLAEMTCVRRLAPGAAW